jgi:hypothetical protein
MSTDEKLPRPHTKQVEHPWTCGQVKQPLHVGTGGSVDNSTLDAMLDEFRAFDIF